MTKSQDVLAEALFEIGSAIEPSRRGAGLLARWLREHGYALSIGERAATVASSAETVASSAETIPESWLHEVSQRAGIDLWPDPIEARRVVTADGSILLVVGPLAALVRTPETLDVAGLRREIEALPGEHECWDGDNFVERHTDLLDRAAVLAIVDRLAATPPPEPAIDVGRLARAIAEGDSIDEPAWFEYGKTTIRKMAAMFAAEYDRLGSEPRITPDELQDDLRDLERGSE